MSQRCVVALDAVQQQLGAFGGKRGCLAGTAWAIAADDEAPRTEAGRKHQYRGARAGPDRAAQLAYRGAARECQLCEGAISVSPQRRRALNQTVSKHETTLDQRDAINGAAAARGDAQKRVGCDEAKLEPLQAAIADLEQKQLTLASLTSSLKELESTGRQGSAAANVG